MVNRRKFIKQSITGAASIAVASHTFAAIVGPQQKGKLGVALVGLGYYSTDILAPALQLTQHCYLAGIVTGTPAKAEQWKKRYSIPDKNIYNYTNFDTIANNADIDVIYIVLPPSMHAEYTIRAAKAGRHVWCEKPMAMSVTECQKMIDACNQNKVKLSIGYRMHHEPNTRQIIQFRKDNKYGAVQHVEASAGYYDGRSGHWKQSRSMGGGAMMDMGVYPLNAARYCTGLEPIAVTAQASTTRPAIYKEVEETIHFQLEFTGGATANCMSTFGKGINELEVKCANGWYKLVPFSTYSGVQGITSDGVKLQAYIPNEQAKQMDDDALAIISKGSVLVPGEEGLRDIRVVEAIHQSVEQHKRIKIGS